MMFARSITYKVRNGDSKCVSCSGLTKYMSQRPQRVVHGRSHVAPPNYKKIAKNVENDR